MNPLTGKTRKIIHVDMDCFYAAVEVKHRPELRGKALGIGGPPNTRSVLCTASYEARKYDVRAAMPSSTAVRLCPHLILIPPNFPLYKKESAAVKEIFSRFSNCIEPLSLDEAYLDVTDSPHFNGSATLIAREIRKLIFHELNLTASAGVAPNKFLAKIASDWRKPNGQFVVLPSEVEAFVKTLPIEKIYGVGKVTAKRMHELGLRTCGDIQTHSMLKLREWFGSRGEDLFYLSRGVDLRPVESHSERKSLTVEETFSEDLQSLDDCLNVLPELFRSWEERMQRWSETRAEGGDAFERIRGAVVKVKYFDFKSTTHEMSFKRPPSLEDFAQLLRGVWEKRADPVRLLGVGVRFATTGTSKEIPYQLPLQFDADTAHDFEDDHVNLNEAC